MFPICQPIGLRPAARFAFDRKAGTGAKSAWIRSRKVEKQYAIKLRKIAKHVDDIVRGFDAETEDGRRSIRDALERYATILDPWARSVAERMVTEVAARDRKAWENQSEIIGRNLAREIAGAPTGRVMRGLMDEQVGLIKSLPIDAAQRVHKMTIEGISQGTRAADIAKRILETGDVTKSRATLIARTEVARTGVELTRARATHVGSTQFIWRTVEDSDVRPSHRKLNGKAFYWNDPPECDPGHHALPGGIWNCRCYAEPVIPD